MELDWKISFKANGITTSNINFVWDLISKEILCEEIGYYKYYNKEFPDYLLKPDPNLGKVETIAEYNASDRKSIYRILNNLEIELKKIDVEFVFWAYAQGSFPDYVYYSSVEKILREDFHNSFPE